MQVDAICSIDGCGKPRYVRGWCNAHYLRWRRYGDPLAARKDTQWRGPEVVERRRVDPQRRWPMPHLALRKKRQRLRHSCGKGHKGCCNMWHLDWKTSKQNHADQVVHDTRQRGERHAQAKLSVSDVHEIRRLAADGTLTRREIGEMYGVTASVISHIHAGQAWGWLEHE